MTAADIAALVVAVCGGGGVATLIKAAIDRRAGISSNAHKAARDIKTDEQTYITRLEDRMARVEGRQAWLENVNAGLWSHIGVLEAWGMSGAKPPPPARPVFEPYRHDDDE